MTEDRTAAEWELVTDQFSGNTYRLPVPGGWIYRTFLYDSGVDRNTAVAMVFIPTPHLPKKTGR